jgi:KUP system potassium uptake protein
MLPCTTVRDAGRVEVRPLGNECHEVRITCGFKDERDIPGALALCKSHGLDFHMMETSFFISRQTVVPTPGLGMALWREFLFAAMYRNARGVADYFRVPASRVIELGTKLEI